MARPRKQGLSYFPMDVDYYDDFKIIDLLEKYGPVGVTVFHVILCMVYREGYYLEISPENLAAKVMRLIGNKWVKDKRLVLQVIHDCAELGLFDKALVMQDVITSAGIQRRYAKATVRNKVDRSSFWLIDDDGQSLIKAPVNRVSAAETPISVTETPVSAAEMQQIKENKNKVKERESLQRGASAAQTQQKGKSAAKSQRADDGCLPVPSLDEVKDFYKSEGLRGNPERFFHLYDARGWRDDHGNRVRNWKALARYWSAGEREQKPTPATVQPKREPTYDLDSWEQLMQDYVPVKE